MWGARGEAAAEHLAKGSPVAVEGRLDWREWEAKDGSGKRQTVEIVAEGVQFLGSSKASKEASSDSEETPEEEARAQAVADEESELRAMTRDQLDQRARNLGIENPERLQNKAAVISEALAAEAVFADLDDDQLGEEDRPF